MRVAGLVGGVIRYGTKTPPQRQRVWRGFKTRRYLEDPAPASAFVRGLCVFSFVRGLRAAVGIALIPT